jgi:hypothetical protein
VKNENQRSALLPFLLFLFSYQHPLHSYPVLGASHPAGPLERRRRLHEMFGKDLVFRFFPCYRRQDDEGFEHMHFCVLKEKERDRIETVSWDRVVNFIIRERIL